ncbi:ankyrin repeat domain-containing protein [Marinobacter pelagius]|uniref:ankyrin repeat domain-containing protein n=1 Tax=Marinobacter sp. C7 TaxID=2951363 RepID=UPI001EEFF595|nr:ankyrin repeat domain-containing protein [Marinobacter sp. C7]MCG7200425.1 ankyrin repeat domain-containing protein [Marinobacter sp. C7]
MSDQNPGSPQKPENQKDEDAIALAQGLFDLARNGGTRMLQPLLDAGVPVDLRTSDGNSLLMLATDHGRAETVRFLLERGANPDLANNLLRTPLMSAATANRVDILELLLEAGADPRAADTDGASALDLAKAHGAEDAAQRLAAAEDE